jgi:hypothetical protein
MYVFSSQTVEMTNLQERLRWLMDIASDNNLGVGIKLRLLADLIESTFDYSSVASAMKEDLWQTCVDELDELMTLLEENPTIEFSSHIQGDKENFKVCSLISRHPSHAHESHCTHTAYMHA